MELVVTQENIPGLWDQQRSKRGASGQTSGVKNGMPILSANFLSVDAKSPARPAASPMKKDSLLSVHVSMMRMRRLDNMILPTDAPSFRNRASSAYHMPGMGLRYPFFAVAA